MDLVMVGERAGMFESFGGNLGMMSGRLYSVYAYTYTCTQMLNICQIAISISLLNYNRLGRVRAIKHSGVPHQRVSCVPRRLSASSASFWTRDCDPDVGQMPYYYYMIYEFAIDVLFVRNPLSPILLTGEGC